MSGISGSRESFVSRGLPEAQTNSLEEEKTSLEEATRPNLFASLTEDVRVGSNGRNTNNFQPDFVNGLLFTSGLRSTFRPEDSRSLGRTFKPEVRSNASEELSGIADVVNATPGLNRLVEITDRGINFKSNFEDLFNALLTAGDEGAVNIIDQFRQVLSLLRSQQFLGIEILWNGVPQGTRQSFGAKGNFDRAVNTAQGLTDYNGLANMLTNLGQNLSTFVQDPTRAIAEARRQGAIIDDASEAQVTRQIFNNNAELTQAIDQFREVSNQLNTTLTNSGGQDTLQRLGRIGQARQNNSGPPGGGGP